MRVDKVIDTGLGLVTKFQQGKLQKNVQQAATTAHKEFKSRVNKPGQMLSWMKLPEIQLKRIQEFFDIAKHFKSFKERKTLTIIGIGGSKHPVEHALRGLGLKGRDNIKFLSDFDNVGYTDIKDAVKGNYAKSNYLVVSKSGKTLETHSGYKHIEEELIKHYTKLGHANPKEAAASHFVAITDAKEVNNNVLRKTANTNNWFGKFFIHEDVGGRFSAFDDHSLISLAFAGMTKKDMRAMLAGARDMSKHALSTDDINKNNCLAKAIHWVCGAINEGGKKILRSIHLYNGVPFDKTTTWNIQLFNESAKDIFRQFLRTPEGMHHSAEAHFNKKLNFVSGLTSYKNTGASKDLADAYVDALNIAYAHKNKFHFHELLDANERGITPKAFGAMTQARGIEQVLEEGVAKALKNQKIGKTYDSVIQPNVEEYKSVLRETTNGLITIA